MHLTGLIIFIFSILGLIIWFIRVVSHLSSKETFINKELHGIGPSLNITPLLIILLLIAISAGMAWG